MSCPLCYETFFHAPGCPNGALEDIGDYDPSAEIDLTPPKKCCEDCGEEVAGRRTRCKNCGQLLCSWCYHHSHKVFAMIASANGDKK